MTINKKECCGWSPANYENVAKPDAESNKEREERWYKDAQAHRDRLQFHIEMLLAISPGNKSDVYLEKRKAMYGKWRAKHGNDVAREWAKLAESILIDERKKPKWFKSYAELIDDCNKQWQKK
jgi:hypothetical protein